MCIYELKASESTLEYTDPTPSPAQTMAILVRLLQWQLDELMQTRKELDLARGEADNLARDLKSVQKKLIGYRQEITILQEELKASEQRTDGPQLPSQGLRFA